MEMRRFRTIMCMINNYQQLLLTSNNIPVKEEWKPSHPCEEDDVAYQLYGSRKCSERTEDLLCCILPRADVSIC